MPILVIFSNLWMLLRYIVTFHSLKHLFVLVFTKNKLFLLKKHLFSARERYEIAHK